MAHSTFERSYGRRCARGSRLVGTSVKDDRGHLDGGFGLHFHVLCTYLGAYYVVHVHTCVRNESVEIIGKAMSVARQSIAFLPFVCSKGNIDH